jgi:ketosteroid isomerase-like protein
MRNVTVGLFLLAISISGFGQNAEPPDLKVAIAVQKAATEKGDTAAVARFRSDDWLITHSNGKTSDKNHPYVAQQQNAPPKPPEIRNEQARVYGSAAISIAEYIQPPAGNRTATNIWVKEKDGWKLLGGHLTYIGDTPPEKPIALTHTPAGKQGFSKVEEAVLQTMKAIGDAYVSKNQKAYEALVTKEFVRVRPNGEASNIAEFMQVMQKENRGKNQNDDIKVRVHGDAAVVTYRDQGFDTKGNPGAPTRMTRLFVKQSGKWMLAFTQSSYIRQQ